MGLLIPWNDAPIQTQRPELGVTPFGDGMLHASTCISSMSRSLARGLGDNMTNDKTRGLGPALPTVGLVQSNSGIAAEVRAFGVPFIAIGLLIASGCAGTHPAPTELMADVQSANRSANELGAQDNPQAKLHLKLAEEQLDQAKVALEDDDDEGAASLLMRAKADAELAVALTREGAAQSAAEKSSPRAMPQPTTTPPPGATP